MRDVHLYRGQQRLEPAYLVQHFLKRVWDVSGICLVPSSVFVEFYIVHCGQNVAKMVVGIRRI